MIKVEILFDVTRQGGGTRQERLTTQVDEKTYDASKGSISRGKLDEWAKSFFPTDKAVRVLRMQLLK